jgi:hypothetical protein
VRSVPLRANPMASATQMRVAGGALVQ